MFVDPIHEQMVFVSLRSSWEFVDSVANHLLVSVQVLILLFLQAWVMPF